MSNVNAAKVEVLKVWYSVFCTVVDAFNQDEYSRAEFIDKMTQLRATLRAEITEVEAELAKSRM